MEDGKWLGVKAMWELITHPTLAQKGVQQLGLCSFWWRFRFGSGNITTIHNEILLNWTKDCQEGKHLFMQCTDLVKYDNGFGSITCPSTLETLPHADRSFTVCWFANNVSVVQRPRQRGQKSAIKGQRRSISNANTMRNTSNEKKRHASFLISSNQRERAPWELVLLQWKSRAPLEDKSIQGLDCSGLWSKHHRTRGRSVGWIQQANVADSPSKELTYCGFPTRTTNWPLTRNQTKLCTNPARNSFQWTCKYKNRLLWLGR